MRIPPWLAGLLMVVVLAGLWWALAGDDPGTEDGQAATPTAVSTGAGTQGATAAGRPTGGATASGSTGGATATGSTGGATATGSTGGATATGSTGGASPVPTPPATEQESDAQGGPDVYRPEPAGTDTRPWDEIDACADDILPATMIPVIEDIWDGGPYTYPDRDGTRFGNYEGHLPDESSSYYREFTVETPGLSHRGARRIVTGGGEPGRTDPDVWYYTDDHYESFCEFAP